jgi:hypothetical protein
MARWIPVAEALPEPGEHPVYGAPVLLKVRVPWGIEYGVARPNHHAQSHLGQCTEKHKAKVMWFTQDPVISRGEVIAWQEIQDE